MSSRTLFLFLALLTCCQSHSRWNCCHIKEKNSNCTRVIYQSEDPIAGIDLEFLQTGSQLSAYLQVHSHPLASNEKEQIQINIQTEDQDLIFFSPYHQGQQRVHLTPELQQTLFSLLKKGKPIHIEVSGYRETIVLENFDEILKKLDNPSFRNPLRLPF